MSWTPLSSRLNTLPLVLAGPILRRVEKDNVSVWIALKESHLLRLTVKDEFGTDVMSGEHQTIPLGINLHVAVITAVTLGLSLDAHKTYSYTVSKYDTASASYSSLTTDSAISYMISGAHTPTFSLPPIDLNDLRIVHASCRKLHAEGSDAFVALDTMISAEAADVNTFAWNRPHQLFLTGDQIYADDVSGILLFLIRDAVTALIGWNETIPGLNNFDSNAINSRGYLISKESGLKFPDDDINACRNHLIFLAEYYCMYLFMWSPALWPQRYEDYPTVELVFDPFTGDTPINRDYYRYAIHEFVDFQVATGVVRKALANVPTYMICDDHEITDDWFLNLKWCNDVITNPLGRRIVQNGLTAYTLFQAWGNVPEIFNASASGSSTEIGRHLLNLIPSWANGYEARDTITPINIIASPSTYWESIYKLLGLPGYTSTQVLTTANHELIPANTIHLIYNYHIAWDKHEVFVMDTRNERAFPGGNDDFPVLISPNGLQRQLTDFSPNAEVTFLVIATPISGIPHIEDGLKLSANFLGKYYVDAEGYSYQESAIESLYATIAEKVAQKHLNSAFAAPGRIVVLSGDVHYGFTNRVEYWANRTYNDTSSVGGFVSPVNFVLAQLCASALKNQKDETRTYGWVKIKTGTNNGHEDGYDDEELAGPNITIGWVAPTAKQTVGTMRFIKPVVVPGPTPTVYTGDRLYITPTERVSNINKLIKSEQSYPPVLTVQPDWTYRIDYLVAYGGASRPSGALAPRQDFATVLSVVDPAVTPAGTELSNYLAAASNAQTYVKHDGYGREAVGKNNIGEIRFSWGATEETKVVLHQLWWRLDPSDPTAAPLPLYPLSAYEVVLGNSADYPKPRY